MAAVDGACCADPGAIPESLMVIAEAATWFTRFKKWRLTPSAGDRL